MSTHTITEQLASVIENERTVHAYLFHGNKGAGKKEVALFFTQALFCRERKEGLPCKNCVECQRVLHGNHPDVHRIQPEGISLKIDQIRELQKEFAYRSAEGARKVYIIEQAEQMTVQAANSLLKFLEEPSEGTIAILLTTNKAQILDTILSRCQEIKFPPPSPTKVIKMVEEEGYGSLAPLVCQITADVEEALALCRSEWFAELRDIVIKLLEEVFNQNIYQAFALIQDKWLITAKERDQIDIGLEMLLLLLKERLYNMLEHRETDHVKHQQLARYMTLVIQAKQRLHANVHPQLLLEQLIIRMQEGSQHV